MVLFGLKYTFWKLINHFQKSILCSSWVTDGFFTFCIHLQQMIFKANLFLVECIQSNNLLFCYFSLNNYTSTLNNNMSALLWWQIITNKNLAPRYLKNECYESISCLFVERNMQNHLDLCKFYSYYFSHFVRSRF